MSFIPGELLDEVKKLAGKEKYALTGRANATTRKLPNRVKEFAPRSAADSIPTFASNSDIQLPPPTKQGNIRIAPAVQKPSNVTALTYNPENAFTHHTTAPRVAHLANGKESGAANDLTFVYESMETSKGPNSNVHSLDGNDDRGVKDPSDSRRSVGQPSNQPDRVKPEDLSIVTTVTKETLDQMQGDDAHGQQFPSLRPTTRKEVALLKHTMVALLRDVGCDLDQDYPTDMHAFLSIIQEEQRIYDAVFQEIIRQVTVNMIERGEVLAEIRKRYGHMFTKIPKHVKHLHTELVAQRKLNRRLSEELIRSKETVAELWSELDSVRKHDSEVTKQAQDAQEKLVSVLTQSDNTDEILEEYHKLYRMQRDRLEEAVRLSEQEKRVWIDAATNLAMRIGQEHGITDLVQLQKSEHSRLRATNHMIVIISNTNDAEMNAIERKIEEWRSKLIKLSQSVVEEDQLNITTLTKMQRDMKIVLKNLNTNEPMDAIEADHPLLKVFHIYDVKSLAEHLMKWVDQITTVAVRFTSDRDLTFQEEIGNIRKIAESWIEAGLKLLRRNEKNTNSKDYLPLSETLTKLGTEIEEWLTKLEMRVSGEDGIASHVISLQNQLEDRYTTYSARDFDKPLPPSERAQLKESLSHWTEQIGVLINTLSNTSEKEQHKIPLHVENWVARLIDQMNTDTDIRNEENLKLHTSMISWMVHLLVKAGREKPTEAWDQEFLQLNQELISFNMNLMRDAADIEMISDDKKDLRTVVQCTVCETVGILTAGRFVFAVNDLRPLPNPGEGSYAERLSLPRVKALLAAALTDPSDIYEKIIGESFEHHGSLNESFPHASGSVPTLEHPGVALESVRESYHLISKSRPSIIAAMMFSIDKVLRRPGRRLLRHQDIKFLMIILENPLLLNHSNPVESNFHHDILARTFGLLSCLLNDLHHYVVNWFARLPLPIFQKRVDLVNHFITYRISQKEGMRENYPTDWGIKSAARVMALLFAANNQRVDKLLVSDFYNTVVDYVNLIKDYWKWQEERSGFSFCQYPFLVSLGGKMQIMETDAKRQMTDRFKEAFFRTAIHRVVTDPFLSLHVRRSSLIEDSLNQLQSRHIDLKKKLRIEFVNEDGVDAGGLTKEWFLLLVRELFDQQYGMFVFDDESHLCWFNVASFENQEEYRLVGIVIGLSIYNSTILDVQFPLACYKKLLGVSVGLEDLKILSPSLGRGLQQLLDYNGDDLEQVFCRDFVAEYEAWGEKVQVPLIPNGDKIAVTQSNKKEFVDRYTNWILNESIEKQFEAFREGFYHVCGGNALSLFRPEEMEMMVRGGTELDIQSLESVTEYEGFRPDEPSVRFFWEIFNGFSSDMKHSVEDGAEVNQGDQLEPFFEDSHVIHKYFPSRELAILVPVLLLVVGISGIGGFIALVMIRSAKKVKKV
ncbi:putative E3 ubiquitin-protein ligase [Blyttiomyces sp. JEL0837]|nr:putative E3 ubiquitin-protein ligase [Blyttiomyces sp. JEL0837]